MAKFTEMFSKKGGMGLVGMILLVLAVLYFLKPELFIREKYVSFAPISQDVDDSVNTKYAASDLSNTKIKVDAGCAMSSGYGLSSSLLPREMASQEEFGQFAPDDILKGQNFLDPRQQVGFPETYGGTIRNANQQIRSEPPNPKGPYMWNNSTIVPDLMRRPLN
tara:strand:- start:287 stop:778 length:492 start_codon:yes stop_codon:yes gene_type:complete